jgi:hypothetical protein
VFVAALAAALAVAASSLAATVTVRVEGKNRTIFGSVPAKIDASNALQALDAASSQGEFYYALTHSSFGDYVSQIGKFPGAGSGGWVFKVNGESPRSERTRSRSPTGTRCSGTGPCSGRAAGRRRSI